MMSTTVPPALHSEAFFDVAADWAGAGLFAAGQPVWSALAGLSDYLAERVAGAGVPALPAGVFADGDVVLAGEVEIEPGVTIHGPALIEDGAVLRQGAYLRGNVLIGPGCVVGHCTELKHTVLWPGAKAPHFNYLGDSVLGRRVNLGAGTVLSNLRLDHGAVVLHVDGQRWPTGLRKLGAILGDDCQTGCHVVLNPGTVAGPKCFFWPQASAVGWFAPGTVVRTPLQRG